MVVLLEEIFRCSGSGLGGFVELDGVIAGQGALVLVQTEAMEKGVD